MRSLSPTTGFAPAFRTASRHRNGFSLVEVALALAVAVFCLVTLMALLPVGLNSGRATTGETAANGILNEVVADLRATTPSATASGQFGIAIPAAGSASTTTLYFTQLGAPTTVTTDARFRLTVTFPATTGGKTATIAIAKVTWPPALTATPSGLVENFVALDRN